MYVEDRIIAAGFKAVGNRPDMVYDCDKCGVHEYCDGTYTAMYEHPTKGVFCGHCAMEFFMLPTKEMRDSAEQYRLQREKERAEDEVKRLKAIEEEKARERQLLVEKLVAEAPDKILQEIRRGDKSSLTYLRIALYRPMAEPDVQRAERADAELVAKEIISCLEPISPPEYKFAFTVETYNYHTEGSDKDGYPNGHFHYHQECYYAVKISWE